MPGTLYVTSTPIGNLEDVTLRSLRILKEADVIACEDTRRTARLLAHYGIRKPLIRYDEHVHEKATAYISRELLAGRNIVLVTDAGTPGLSDPGQRLVQNMVRQGLRVSPVAGASAVTAALSVSGFPASSFIFLGFLPRKQGAAVKTLQAASRLGKNLVVFESPHRLQVTLSLMRDALGEVPVLLARELTKIHEELLRGTPGELLKALESLKRIQGEITLVVSIG